MRYLLIVFIGVIGGISCLKAQEAIRSSLAGESAATSHLQDFDQSYNMKAGPVLFNMSAGTTFGYNDNINLSQTNRESDFIITPNVGLTGHWPVTAINSLNLNVGLGYSKYLEHPEADTKAITISPDSILDFVVYTGDFKFTFYDSFSIQQDPISEIDLANVTTFGRISNTAGFDVDWDLNQILLSAGYSHTTFMATSAEFKYTDSDCDSVYQRTSYTVNPTTTAGWSHSISYTTYDQDVLNNNWSFMSGPFVNTQLTPNLNFSATAGGQYISAATGGSINDNTSNFLSWYASMSLSHRINNYMTETLTLSHTNPIGLNSDFTKLDSAQYGVSWQVIKDVSLGTSAFIEHSDDSGGLLSESVWRYGGSVMASRNLTQKISASINYTFTQRDSDVDLRDYYQNLVTLNLNYSF